MSNSVVITMVGELRRGEGNTVDHETYLTLEGEWEGDSTTVTRAGWGNNVFCF